MMNADKEIITPLKRKQRRNALISLLTGNASESKVKASQVSIFIQQQSSNKDEQSADCILTLYLIYIVIIVIFHNTLIMKSFRLLTTFLHERSHAIACWITCGSVQAIRVYDNEGGVTSYYGGCRALIIPAG